MKKLLIISIAFNVCVILFLIGKRYYYAYASAHYVDAWPDQWNYQKTDLYSKLTIDSNDIVFVGNSITEAFPVTEIYGLHYKNRGISRNHTYHVLQRIAGIAKCYPKKIFFEVGINDLNSGISIDSIMINYNAIIAIVKRITPRTEIYIESILPTAYDYAKLNPEIVKLNDRLKSYCDLEGVTFVDIYPRMATNGQLDNSITADGTHLNAKGYSIMQKCISPYL